MLRWSLSSGLPENSRTILKAKSLEIRKISRPTKAISMSLADFVQSLTQLRLAKIFGTKTLRSFWEGFCKPMFLLFVRVCVKETVLGGRTFPCVFCTTVCVNTTSYLDQISLPQLWRLSSFRCMVIVLTTKKAEGVGQVWESINTRMSASLTESTIAS